MGLLLSSQASKRKGASKKTSYWLACLFVFISFLVPTTTRADSRLDTEMANAYQQIFGKAHTKTKNVKKPKKVLKRKAKRKTISNKNKDPDLVAFYNQVFDKNNQTVGQKSSISNPVKATKSVRLPKKALVEKVESKKTVKSRPAVPAPATIIPLSQNTNTSALHAQGLNNTESTEEEDSSEDSQAVDLNALFAKAFGKKLAPAPSEINVDLRVNKESIGDVTVYSNKQGRMDKVKGEQLLPLLEEVIKEHIFKRIEKNFAKKEKVRFKELKALGMRASYNPTNLSLDLQIKPSLRKPRILSMRSKAKGSVREENKLTAEDLSAYLNMYSNLGIVSGSKNDLDLKMKLESSVRLKNVVIENNFELKNKKWDIGKTSLTYDEPDKLRRFVVGDISTGNRNFQENLKLRGIRMSKEFFMDPDVQIRPKADESFILESDSEIEVYVNNQLLQRYYLKEGIYSLQDIGLYEGENNIRVRIKDEFGKITEKTSQQFYDSHLLKPGLSLYAVSLGILSDREAYINEKLEEEPILSGYFQKGLTENLTMSLDAQISPSSYLLGTEAIASIPLGSIKYSLGASGAKDKNMGYATRFEFKPNVKREVVSLDTLKEDSLGLDKSMGSFLSGWKVSGELRSRDFAMLNDVDNINEESKKLKARLQTQLGFGFGNQWRGSLDLGLSDYYDADKNLSARLSASKRFTNGVRFSAGARYDSEDDFSVNLQVSIALSRENHKRNKDVHLLYNGKDNSYETRLNVAPLSLYGKNSLSGSLVHQQNDTNRQQKVEVRYKNTHFETQFNARNNSNLEGNIDSQQMSLGFNSSIACVGKKCATSTPINDSFALVTGPSNQDRPIAINNGNSRFIYSGDNNDLPDNYTALIGKKGSGAVVPLDSYIYQRINIDEATLPRSYDSEKTEFEVFPRYHQGYLIQAGGEPSVTVDGILIDKDRKPLAYKGGQWIPIAKEGKTIAFFSNKIGRFRVSSIPAGKYKLELFEYPDMQTIRINVPDKKGGVHDTGSLVIAN